MKTVYYLEDGLLARVEVVENVTSAMGVEIHKLPQHTVWMCLEEQSYSFFNKTNTKIIKWYRNYHFWHDTANWGKGPHDGWNWQVCEPPNVLHLARWMEE